MGVKLSIAVIATFALTISGLVSQIQPQTQSFTAFDCGTITGLQAQGSQLFNDFGHGFQFEFPANWHGSNISLSDLHTGTTITIDPRFAIHDPRFYIPQAARAVGTKAVNGLEWTVLAGPGWDLVTTRIEAAWLSR